MSVKPLVLGLALLAAVPAAAQTPVPAGPNAPAPAKSDAPAQAVTGQAVLAQYGRIVHAGYEDALNGARAMQEAIRAFTAQPTQEGLVAARKAWLAARESYGQTEAFRFYGGPIDDEDGPEGRINAWPLDESYIDGVEGDEDAGFINDVGFAITRENLAEQNERGGEENVSTGWHAIEFLLWGQDQRDDGPGDRSYRDFVDGGRAHADRRRQYLDVVTGLLVDDLGFLVESWAPGAQNYRAGFEKGGTESIRKIFVGLGSLSRGELAGERLEVALASQDQEDEHSCFSDNTHRDTVTNARGIQNAWLGRYRRADGSELKGAGLRDLVAARDPAIARRTTEQIAASLAATEAIRAPVDREINGGPDAPGRQRIRKAVDSLTRQSKDLVDAAAAVGITRLTLVTPE